MFKLKYALFAIFITGCAPTIGVTESIINGVQKDIDRAAVSVQNSVTLEQCQNTSYNALAAISSRISDIELSCKNEVELEKSNTKNWKLRTLLLAFLLILLLYFQLKNPIKGLFNKIIR